MRDSITHGRSADDWFAKAERIWAEHKSSTTKETLAEWVNYQGKITGQSAESGYLVIYNAAGSNWAYRWLIPTLFRLSMALSQRASYSTTQPTGIVPTSLQRRIISSQYSTHRVWTLPSRLAKHAGYMVPATFIVVRSRRAPSPPSTRATPITSGSRN